MLTVLLLLSALLQDATPPSPPATDAKRSERQLAPPPLQLAQWLKAERPLVVIASVTAVQTVGLGTDIVHLKVERELHTASVSAEPTLILLSPAGHARKGQRGMFCVRPYKQGKRFELIERVLNSDPNFETKQELLRAAAGLLRLPRDDLRQAASFELITQNLARKDPWRQRWALDELRWLAVTHPEVLVPARRQRLTELAARLDSESLRADVKSVAAVPELQRDS